MGERIGGCVLYAGIRGTLTQARLRAWARDRHAGSAHLYNPRRSLMYEETQTLPQLHVGCSVPSHLFTCVLCCLLSLLQSAC